MLRKTGKLVRLDDVEIKVLIRFKLNVQKGELTK